MDFGYVFDDLYELVCMNFYLYTLSRVNDIQLLDVYFVQCFLQN